METKQWSKKYQQSVATPPSRPPTVAGTTTVLETTTTNPSPKPQLGDTISNDTVTKICIKNEEPIEEKSSSTNDSLSFEIGNKTEKTNSAEALFISEEAKQTIHTILEQIKSLSPIEQYYLYLKLPLQLSEVDPFRQPLNPLGSRSEIHRTISWIKTHLEEDPDVSLPKQEVYEEYGQFCMRIKMKALSQADFGKVMKQVYPRVRARRLGNRGKSRYCYSGLRRYVKLKPPHLPDLVDKPMSSEIPCTQSSLTSAAWLIVRDWSQQQLGIQFSSLQTLAYYLILNNSIGVGTDAANKLKAVADSQLKEENKNGNKHREMQLQLQRKIQQKNELQKDRKRKNQSPKCELKSSCKKTKSNVKLKQENTIVSNEVSTNGANSINSNQGKQIICDKSLDFTKQQQQLPTLPDFNSFQKPTTCGNILDKKLSTQTTAAVFSGDGNNTVYKVAIPRITQQISPPNTKKLLKISNNVKYKAIQPKLQAQQEPQQNNCDIALYNQQAIILTADNRSQNTDYNIDRIRERKFCDNADNSSANAIQNTNNINSNECNEHVEFPLTRERINSISNVEKDAMDEYLGTNNSQHEEEICKYFPNTNTTALKDQSSSSNDETKLSALRQLLEQNLIDNPHQLQTNNTPIPSDPIILTTQIQQQQQQQTHQHSTIAIQQSVIPNHQIRRRVSFETPLEEPVVPPSPNTRRKNFSFTPISPIIDPQSPVTPSKCSSRNASPFVSPRNTPVQRTKCLKRGEIEPQSAPVSPMLKQLLNTANNNNNRLKLHTIDGTSNEVSQFFSNTTTQTPSSIENLTYNRSQSVPLNHHIDTCTFLTEITNGHNDINDFNELDPIVDTDTDNVKRILNELDEQQTTNCDNNNVDIFNVDVNELLNTNLLYNNNSSNLIQLEHHQQQQQQQQQLKLHHFRSVPNTPLSFMQNNTINDFLQTTSRSYPSTPIIQTNNNFSINLNNSDCLLNGQPIHPQNDGAPTTTTATTTTTSVLNSDNNIEIETKTFNCIEVDGEFAQFENTNQLIDENCVLINQNYDNI